MHQHCYVSLGRELYETQPLMEDLPVSKNLDSVQVRTEPEVLPSDPNQEAYAIEDRDGNVLGYTTTLNGPEQRTAIAKVMGVDESKISYKGDDEDENGPVEVWGLIGVPVPVMSRFTAACRRV
jgi:hypothetical protein